MPTCSHPVARNQSRVCLPSCGKAIPDRFGRGQLHRAARVGEAHYLGGMSAEALPGADLIEAGLADLSAGVESVASLLVSIGAPRLSRAGLELPPTFADAEHRLYARLASEDPAGAHSRYNALIRRLVSYERSLEFAR